MKNIAIVMGGYSDESVISIRSGQLLLEYIDKQKYQPFEVHILKNEWMVIHESNRFSIDKADFSFTIFNKKITFDAIVNTIHGTPGEDGHMQAYWELINIPYTGCSFYQSALTFNKRDTLSVLTKFNIPKATSIYTNVHEMLSYTTIKEKLGIPFFVKPNQSGSSLGVSKVNNEISFTEAIDKAFKEDNEILIESFLKGIEVSVGVLKYENNTKVLGITEIVSENDFFDYEAKYLGKSQEITPARIDKETEIAVYKMAEKVYNALNMTGFSRIDFIIVENTPHFIEINTNPGLSAQSIFPQQVKYANLNFTKLIDNEIELAFKRKPIWNK